MSDRSPPASRNGSANAERAHRMVERFFDILKLLSYSAAIIQLQWTYATLVSLRPTNLDAEHDGHAIHPRHPPQLPATSAEPKIQEWFGSNTKDGS